MTRMTVWRTSRMAWKGSCCGSGVFCPRYDCYRRPPSAVLAQFYGVHRVAVLQAGYLAVGAASNTRASQSVTQVIERMTVGWSVTAALDYCTGCCAHPNCRQ
jgi:hypothetical protein